MNYIKDVGVISAIGEVSNSISERYTVVSKLGRSTGLTSGTTLDFSYKSTQGLTDLLLIKPSSLEPGRVSADLPRFCAGGDSGAPVFVNARGPDSPRDVTLIGLLQGGTSDGWGLACKIQNVFEKLSLQLASSQGEGTCERPWYVPRG